MTFSTRPALQGTFGMVSATHYLASAAGMAILERGGNAFDAAVATGFTLQVVEPHLNGPGGDMSLLFATAHGAPTVLCGQGPAPAGATVDHFRQLGLTQVPGSGLLAAAIPGSTVAWLTLLRDHGTMALDDVLGFAVHYATVGIPVLASIARTITGVAGLFTDHWSTSAAVYLPGGRPPAVGGQFRNPVLAGTYRRLTDAARGLGREAGIDAALGCWRTGFVAEAVDAFARTEWQDSSGTPHAGVVTGHDLAEWSAGYERPQTFDVAGWTVAKTGPWGQGPVLLQQLALLAGVDVRPGSADFVHTVVEGAKLAFADRDAYYGDTADVPMQALLSAEYTAGRRALIIDRASRELRPGSPAGRVPRLPRWDGMVGQAGTGEPTVPRDSLTDPEVAASGETRGDTCHLDVVDRWGNMVAATPSGGWLQSSPVIPELGFPLGTRLQMTTLEPDLPTTLTPGRRPRTTLSPTLVSAGDKAVLAFGTPGGDQQDQWQVPFLLAHLAGLDLQQAIDAPMFHTTHFPSSFYPHESHPGEIVVESRFGPAVIDDLRTRGHQVVESGPWSLGRLCAVSRDPETMVLRAGADPRGMQSYAVGR